MKGEHSTNESKRERPHDMAIFFQGGVNLSQFWIKQMTVSMGKKFKLVDETEDKNVRTFPFHPAERLRDL